MFAGVAILFPAVSRPVSAGEPPQAEQYELIDDWRVSAQGPILREKRVVATYALEVTDVSQPGDPGRTLQVRVVDVAVDAKIPAQRRSGNLDSRRLPETLDIEHHELVRPLSLWQRRFDLTFTPENILQEVTGADEAVQRLAELYDEHLRGSEQDLYTRQIERDRLDSAALRKSWASLFLIPAGEFQESAAPHEVVTEIEFIACIPSESWMTTVRLPLSESVTATQQQDGTTTITRTGELAQSETVETVIGDGSWKYAPQTAERKVMLKVRPDGRVESYNASAQTFLQSTLSIGKDVPITMTIEHSRTLSRR